MEDGEGWVVRRPHVGVAREVADQLRRKLLSGDLADGDLLPKQEDLARLYGTSKLAVREALRILETEGLVRVRRGKVGGAVVQLPTPHGVSYTLSLVLQTRHVSFAEVRAALLELEPLCASLCAARSDRRKAVLPSLQRSQRSLRAAIKDENAVSTVAAIRQFHEALVECCGNQPLIVTVGALESIWTTHASASGQAARAAGNTLEPHLREATAESHEEILRYIELGDADGAAKASKAHLESAGLHRVPLSPDFPIDAAAVRDKTDPR